MMIITGHKLDGVPFLPAGTPRRLMKPELLVIHYTATQFTPKGDFAAKDAQASSHLIIDIDGSILQMVEFNSVAWHAGKSVWRNRTSCNLFSIGIEIVNPGPLVERNGILCDTTAKKPWLGEFIEAKHKNSLCPFRRWACYSDAQLEATKEAAKAICSTYGITSIVGHDDISPGRKIDPGPAFPMAAFVAEVLG